MTFGLLPEVNLCKHDDYVNAIDELMEPHQKAMKKKMKINCLRSNVQVVFVEKESSGDLGKRSKKQFQAALQTCYCSYLSSCLLQQINVKT